MSDHPNSTKKLYKRKKIYLYIFSMFRTSLYLIRIMIRLCYGIHAITQIEVIIQIYQWYFKNMNISTAKK